MAVTAPRRGNGLPRKMRNERKQHASLIDHGHPENVREEVKWIICQTLTISLKIFIYTNTMR